MIILRTPRVERSIFGYQMPPGWIQSVEPQLVVVILLFLGGMGWAVAPPMVKMKN